MSQASAYCLVQLTAPATRYTFLSLKSNRRLTKRELSNLAIAITTCLKHVWETDFFTVGLPCNALRLPMRPWGTKETRCGIHVSHSQLKSRLVFRLVITQFCIFVTAPPLHLTKSLLSIHCRLFVCLLSTNLLPLCVWIFWPSLPVLEQIYLIWIFTYCLC